MTGRANRREAALTEAVLASVGGATSVADLFSGVGTFALPLAAAGGYRLASLTPVDQFLFSAHLELAAVFTR